MDATYVQLLARRIAGKFRGKFPSGVTAADAEQDAALLVIERAPQYEARVGHKSSPPSFEAWIVKHCWGVLMDKYQRAWRSDYAASGNGYSAGPLPLDVNPPLVDDPAENTGLAIDIKAALARLSEPERYAVEAHARGDTQADIGAHLGYTQSYVSQIISRAHAKLREYLKDYSEEETP